MSQDQFVNLSNSKRPGSDTYSKVIEEIQNNKECPFCEAQLSKYHKNPILKEGTYWKITDNMYPYKGTQYHILFIHKEHILTVQEMKPEAWNELQDMITWLTGERNITGGALMMRFGDTKYTGASVNHLHAHLVMADINREDKGPVLVRVG